MHSARASRFFVRFLAVIAWLRRETFSFHAPALLSRWAQRKNILFLFLNLDTVLSDLTPENVANIWQIKWTGILKLETVRIHFISDVFGLLSSRILLPWQRDVTASPPYSILKIRFHFSRKQGGSTFARKIGVREYFAFTLFVYWTFLPDLRYV